VLTKTKTKNFAYILRRLNFENHPHPAVSRMTLSLPVVAVSAASAITATTGKVKEKS
jgi:hypothetical protein